MPFSITCQALTVNIKFTEVTYERHRNKKIDGNRVRGLGPRRFEPRYMVSHHVVSRYSLSPSALGRPFTHVSMSLVNFGISTSSTNLSKPSWHQKWYALSPCKSSYWLVRPSGDAPPLRTTSSRPLVHGFYLCMMGVRYNSGCSGGYRTLWPGQYAWLLINGLVSWQDHKSWGLAKEEIADKNKADGLVKLAALLQVIWFTLQCITRSAYRLPLATIETMTLAYVFNGLVTYAFWWEKPKDIVTASFVNLPEMT